MNGAAVIQPAPIPFYTVLVLYLGIMAFIGWYAGRKTNNIGDFFVLSGKAGVVVSGIAYFSTQFSMGTFLGTPGTIYGVGYAGMAISVPGAVFCMICDLIARMALAPVELNISTVTSIFGAPVVIFMMVRGQKGR